MSSNIDYIIASPEFYCHNNQSLSRKFKTTRKFNQYDVDCWKYLFPFTAANLSRLKESKQLSFNFKILSLQIKYKGAQRHRVLSITKSNAVEKISTLKWDASSLVDEFQNYGFRILCNGPIQNNLWLSCAPKAFKRSKMGCFQYG